MMQHSYRSIAALFALAALAVATATSGSHAVAAAIPTPAAAASGDTPPPLGATATPLPAGQLVRFAGQILDDRAGFVFFTTGDGFRLDPNVKVDDAASGGATALVPTTRV